MKRTKRFPLLGLSALLLGLTACGGQTLRTADCNFFDMLRAPAIKRGPSALFTAPPWF